MQISWSLRLNFFSLPNSPPPPLRLRAPDFQDYCHISCTHLQSASGNIAVPALIALKFCKPHWISAKLCVIVHACCSGSRAGGSTRSRGGRRSARVRPQALQVLYRAWPMSWASLACLTGMKRKEKSFKKIKRKQDWYRDLVSYWWTKRKWSAQGRGKNSERHEAN